MNTDQIRDELARIDRAYFSMDREMGPIGWCDKNGRLIGDHPFPSTLDGANAAVPGSFKWRRFSACWVAIHDDCETVVEVPVTGETLEHKIHDLYALALACVRAEEKTNGKA